MPAPDICAQRLINQRLVTQKLDKGSDVVRLLGAVQAQDYLGAKWALSQRTLGATDADLEKELIDGSIIRTHVLRPTWHFAAPEDIRWMLALTAPRVRAILAHHDRTLEIDQKLLHRSREVLAKALTGGRHLTRTELAAALTAARVRVDGSGGQRLARLVMHAELDGLICSGPRRGKQFTYALLDDRVPPGKTLHGDDALRELAMRYFTTRGPATVDDFAWWSGLTKSAARKGVLAAESSLERAMIDKRDYWFPAARADRMRSPFVRLLSNYDEYFIGHKDRSAIHAHLRASGVTAIPSAAFGHILTVDGQVAGHWARAISETSAVVRLSPLVALNKTVLRAVALEVRRFAGFLGMPVRVA